MNGHRKAALALHAVSAADRALVLAELPEDDRRILHGYLGELDAIGFEAGAVAEALAPAQDSGPREVVRAASVATMARVLEPEPASLVVALLRMEAWPWVDPLVASMPPARRLAVAAMLADAPAHAPGRDAALLPMVATAVKSAQRSAPPPAKASAHYLAPLGRLVSRWKR